MPDKLMLDFEISGEKLFKALKNSAYMKSRGYDIVYANVLCDQESGKAAGFGVCYTEGRYPTSSYVHLRMPSDDMITNLDYSVTMGNKETILKDLESLLGEIKTGAKK